MLLVLTFFLVLDVQAVVACKFIGTGCIYNDGCGDGDGVNDIQTQFATSRDGIHDAQPILEV